MMKIFLNGEIVGRQAYKSTPEDVCPQDVQQQIDGIAEGEDVEVVINSLGGDVFAGLQISSILRDLSASGHKTVAVIQSIAASIASVIACSCDEIKMIEGSYMMCHLPWSCVQGNALELAKEISTLEQCKASMIKIYKTKFDLTDVELDEMLAAETWIDTDHLADYKLNCTVVGCDAPVRIAAKLSNCRFRNVPKNIISMEKEEIIEEEKKTEEIVEETVEEVKPEEAVCEPEEEKAKEEVTEETVEETVEKTVEEIDEKDQKIEELQKKIEELEEIIRQYTEQPVEDRVKGMQSKMQLQINALNKDYSAKIIDFESQIKAKDEALAKAQATATSLKTELDEAKENCLKMASALESQKNALDALHSGVLAASEQLPRYQDGLSKCKTPEERIAFISSGKYTI